MAYELNKAEPRLFSKFNAKNNSNTYNVTLAQAAEASSAAPLYFSPKEWEDKWNPGKNEVLIDGGVIANNPALYAYIHANEISNHDAVRMVSLGTGTKQVTPIDPQEMSVLSWVK